MSTSARWFSELFALPSAYVQYEKSYDVSSLMRGSINRYDACGVMRLTKSEPRLL